MNQKLEKDIKDLEISINAAVNFLKEELQGVRSNRPSVELFENIKVNCYDQTMTVKQLCSLSLKPPREIEIQVWDKSVISAIAKAIEDAKIGMNVSNDGVSIRASLPMLTDERRKELTKLAGKMTEAARIKLRSRRDEFIKKLKSAEDKGEITEDELFQTKEKTQKLIDGANHKMENMLGDKIKEIEE